MENNTPRAQKSSTDSEEHAWASKPGFYPTDKWHSEMGKKHRAQSQSGVLCPFLNQSMAEGLTAHGRRIFRNVRWIWKTGDGKDSAPDTCHLESGSLSSRGPKVPGA